MTPTRGSALARALLGLGGMSAALVSFTACSCDFTDIRSIDQATYDRLHEQYGAGLIDEAACQGLCGSVAEPDSGFSRSTIVTRECRLVRIDWTRPGLECKQTNTDCAIGRRPAGLGPIVGERLARTARLEAASVVAFLRLGQDLRRLGAPEGLIAAAHRAARDEDQHAQLVLDLARRGGVEPEPVTLAPVGPRPLVDIAVENAVEGCVGETLGVVEAAGAARTHPDPAVRRAMTRIARDEAMHAALAWAVHDWAWERLGQADRRRVRAAWHDAVGTLQAQGRWPDGLHRLIGGWDAAGAERVDRQ